MHHSPTIILPLSGKQILTRCLEVCATNLLFVERSMVIRGLIVSFCNASFLRRGYWNSLGEEQVEFWLAGLAMLICEIALWKKENGTPSYVCTVLVIEEFESPAHGETAEIKSFTQLVDCVMMPYSC